MPASLSPWSVGVGVGAAWLTDLTLDVAGGYIMT
jgi:hypothetical protein